MTDAQAVAAIAAARARAAYRNNAVAPLSTDPTDDAVTGLGDAQPALFRQHLPAAKLLVASGRGHYVVPHLLPQELQFIDRILML